MVSVLVTGLSPPPIHVQNSNFQGGSHPINVYGEEGKESEIRTYTCPEFQFSRGKSSHKCIWRGREGVRNKGNKTISVR